MTLSYQSGGHDQHQFVRKPDSMVHIEEKYHNNPYFQTLFVRFALDYNEQNLYFLTANY